MLRRIEILCLVTFVALSLFRFYPISLPSWYEKELDQVNIAQNLATSHFNIFKTKINFNLAFMDPNQDVPIPWTEDFPLFPLAAAVISKIGSMDVLWIGRFLSFICFLMASVYLFLFVKRRYSKSAAYWSLVFFGLSPTLLAHSTYFIGDMAMVCAFLGCLVHLEYFFKRKQKHWIMALFWAIALTTVRYYGVLLLVIPILTFWLLHQPFKKSIRDKSFILFFLIPPLIEGSWLLYSLFSFQHPIAHSGHWGNWKYYLWDSTFYYWSMFLRLSKYNVTFVGFLFLLVGLWKWRRDLFLWSYIALTGLSLAFFTTGHDIHYYYQFKFIPLLIICAALGVSSVFEKVKKYQFVVAIVLILVCLELSFGQAYKLMRYDSGPKILGEQILRLTEPTHKLVVIQDVPDPGVFVYGQRMGWQVGPETLKNPESELLYKRGDILVIRLSEGTLMKSIDYTLGKISELKQRYLTLWESQMSIGKQNKCGMVHFFRGACDREKYYLLILKLR